MVEAKALGPTTLAAPAAERALLPSERISVLGAAQVPASFQVDAELGEWALFAEGQPTPLTPSFVVVTATADSVVLVGRVRQLPEQGLRLQLANEAPQLPPIGILQRGGGVSPLQCDAPDDSGYNAPFDSDTCHRLLEEYDVLQESYTATFVRQLHLTPQALLAATGDKATPVADAKYAFKAGEGAVTFEAVLPLSALPRISGIELSSLSVTAERASAQPPGDPKADAAQSVAFANPIRFGVDSQALECLMQAQSGMPMSPRFSYQPGAPNRVFSAANAGGGLAIAMTDVTLSSQEKVFGAIEVRSVHGASPVLAIFKQGELLQCVNVGDVLGVVERGRGLHVISYHEGVEESVGAQYAQFQVSEIDADGTLREDLLEVSEEGFAYASVGEEHAKNLTTFSISGIYSANEGGNQEHQLLWRYDARANRYALRQRKGRYFPPTYAE